MTDWICTDLDTFQWQRKVAAAWAPEGYAYEMYEVQYIDFVEEARYFAGGGLFAISDYGADDVKHALDSFGYHTMENLKSEYGRNSERILAECLFECNWADFPIESFDTEAEAVAFVDRCMEGDE